jgi:hypothetical protein
LNTIDSYNPSLQGAIKTIDFSFDINIFSFTPGVSLGVSWTVTDSTLSQLINWYPAAGGVEGPGR